MVNTNKSTKKDKDKNMTAYTHLLSLVREFELVYNLSPELNDEQKNKLLSEINRIFNNQQI